MIEYLEFAKESLAPEIADHLSSLSDHTDAMSFGVLARDKGDIVGHVLVRIQQIAPMLVGPLALETLQNLALPSLRELSEGLILDFEVLATHRRRGIGSELQRRAIAMSRARALHQLRSWSSLDSPHNYRLKLRLGFAAVPGTQYIERISRWVEGCYFVMPLHGESSLGERALSSS